MLCHNYFHIVVSNEKTDLLNAVYYVAILMTTFWVLLVCPSICHIRAPNSKTDKSGKNTIGVNVPQGRNNWCANYQLSRSELGLSLGLCSYRYGWPHVMSPLG